MTLSADLPTAQDSVPTSTNATRSGIRRLWSEPLAHFALLGALVFAGHRFVTRAPEAPAIDVSVAKQRELSRLFEQRQGRAPTDTERHQLVQRHVEDEVLFREGLRLSLVNTDPMLRAQVVARVRGLLQAEVTEKPPTDAEVQSYYATHRADYGIPETLDYREYFFRSGPDANDDSRRLVMSLQRGEEDAPDAKRPLPVDYTKRSEAQLASLLGPELAHTLWTLPANTWRELRSSRGVHVVRVSEHTAPQDLPFATLREQIAADYRKETTARAFQGEVDRLTSGFQVHVSEQP